MKIAQMAMNFQVKQAAIAIGRQAKAEGLSAQSAAQVAAAGAQEAAKKNHQSQAVKGCASFGGWAIFRRFRWKHIGVNKRAQKGGKTWLVMF